MEDQEILQLLRGAVERGDVDVALDVRSQHHVDSPLYRDSDSSPFIYISMLAAIAAMWFYGWQAAAAVLVVAGIIYMFGVRRFVAARMDKRMRDTVLADPEQFRKAWKLKGISFRHKASGTVCESPDGLWRSFALERCR